MHACMLVGVFLDISTYIMSIFITCLGNKSLLRVQPMWKMFFHHYEERKAVTTFKEFTKKAHGPGNWM